MPSQKKIQIVSSLIEKLKSYPNFIIVGYEKIPHVRLEELRKVIGQASFKVVKNSLLKVAAVSVKKQNLVEGAVLKGNSAILNLPKDWSSSLSSFWKFAKGEETLSFKIGIVDDKVYDKETLVKLATLPPREVLVAKIITSLRSPQIRLVYAMQFNMTRFVTILKHKA